MREAALRELQGELVVQRRARAHVAPAELGQRARQKLLLALGDGVADPFSDRLEPDGDDARPGKSAPADADDVVATSLRVDWPMVSSSRFGDSGERGEPGESGCGDADSSSRAAASTMPSMDARSFSRPVKGTWASWAALAVTRPRSRSDSASAKTLTGSAKPLA